MSTDDKPDKNNKKRKLRTSKQEKQAYINLGRTPVLNVDGFKTLGLNDKDSIKLTKVTSFKIDQEHNVQSALAHEKKRTKAIQKLLKSLHPGYVIPDGASFTGLVLSGRDLERTRFTNCSLKNTKLRECLFRGAVFIGCDFTGADFRKSDLADTIFDRCNFSAADLRHCNLSRARIIDSNLLVVNFDHCTLDEAVIETCSMEAPSFYNSSCKGVTYSNIQVTNGFFAGTDMSAARMSNVFFRECTLTDTHFDKAVIDQCSFRGCDSFQQGAIFSYCIMTGVVIMDCALEGSEFVCAKLSNSRFERVSMESALLDGAIFKNVVFDAGTMTNCYTLEEAPIFNACQLKNVVIENADFSNADFNKSVFIGATINGSDFENWIVDNTQMDANTTIQVDQ